MARSMGNVKAIASTILWTALYPAVLHAHPGHVHAAHEGSLGGGMFAGFVHPLMGIDHLLALLTVGLLSAQGRDGMSWRGPLSFLSGVAIGGLTGLGHRSMFGIELAIATSVLLLGAALGAKKAQPNILLLSAFALFGLFHGYAHGSDLPSMAQPWGYVIGFMGGSLFLLLGGLFAGVLAGNATETTRPRWVRNSGASVALAGLFFLVRSL